MSAAVPFSEPPWLLGLPSPIYTDSHRRWQAAIRPFIEEHLHARAREWERAETVPDHVFGDFAHANMLIPALPAPLPVAWLKRLGIHELLGGLRVEDFDYLHGAIFADEMTRSGLAGPGGSLTTGMAFGVPPILKFGDQQLQERFLPELLKGQKRSCIAITEPDAGSDVANITTTAVKSKCGKFYIVNGTKKWITNGIWTDYSSMAVRTGPEGSGGAGLSMLVVPLKSTQGVSMRRLKVAGQISAGTTYIELDDVKVPVENLIGQEGMGMRYIMTNFNHERLTIAVGTTRQARVALSAAFEYVLRREAFGKPLMDQPVVRHRLAKAGALLESQSAWVEQFAYQMTRLKKDDADRELGGLTGLLKAQAGIVLKECADVAVLLFGGNGYTRSGQGEIAEMIYREVPGTRIPGGSEDVMLDLAVRQLVKLYKAKTQALVATSKLFWSDSEPRDPNNHINTLAKFKYQGPSCSVSSLDLYEPRSQTCRNRTSMLEAMSNGGRVGKDAPYTAKGCDMVWYNTKEVCQILGRFSQVMLVGDSMLRHIIGALNILIREDLGYGAVTDWNFNADEKRDCFCLNQFNVKTCSVQGIYKTTDVLVHDPESLVCPKLIPGWSTDLSIEQINRSPIPDVELTRLRSSVHGGQPTSKPKVFILGQGLWNDLQIEASVHWLDAVLSVINRHADYQAPTLLVTPNACGKHKPDRWLVTQGNKALARFEEAMADAANKQGIDHLGTWNMSIQATLYDGLHLDMRGNLLKAMMVVNWLALLNV